MSPIQLETRIQELIEGVLPEGKWPELREELYRSGETRKLYCTYVRMHAVLDRRVKGFKAVLAHTPLVPVEDLEDGRRRRSFRHAVLAAAAVLIAAAILMRMVFLSPEPPVLAFQTAPGSQFTLTHGGQDTPLEGQRLEVGSQLILSQGVVELSFGSGVRSIVRGPANLTLHAEDQLQINEGTAWFHVPEKASGFRVLTPELKVIDLGTEFGVVCRPGEPDEIHVFTGKVEARARVGARTVATLTAGSARSVSIVGGLSKIDPRPERFLVNLPSTLPYLHWTFDDADPARLTTGGSHPAAGHVENKLVSPGGGAAFASVPGKFGRALSSLGKSGYVETNWPGIGANAPRTLAYWMRIPPGPQYKHAVVGWGARNVLPSGRAFLSHIRTQSHGATAGATSDGIWYEGSTPIDDGRWHHHAIIYTGRSMPDGDPEIYCYVDGRLEPVTRHMSDGAPTDSRGNMVVDTDCTGPDALPLTLFSDLLPNERKQGYEASLAIDELFIFEAALSNSQIRNIYQTNNYLRVSESPWETPFSPIPDLPAFPDNGL